MGQGRGARGGGRRQPHVTPPRSGDGRMEGPGRSSSSSSKKLSRGGKEIEMDENEIFAMSSGTDSDGDEGGGGGLGNDREVDDLEKTLDTWLSRQKKHATIKQSVDDVLSESKVSRERREQRRKLLGEERDWLTAGYDDGSAEEVVEDAGVVAYTKGGGCSVDDDDGEVAEMQCMLADVLMSKNPDEATREVDYDGDGVAGDDNYDDDDF